jgi:hypothetical protein
MKKAANIKNPVAKDLRTPKYRQRIVRDPNLYNRKIKHKNNIIPNIKENPDNQQL